MVYLRYIALISGIAVHLGVVPGALAFEATTFHPGQGASWTPARPLVSTGGKTRRGPMLSVDGILSGSKRQFERLRSIHQKYLGNAKKETWATGEYFRRLTEHAGAHLAPDGSRRLSLLRRLYGLPLLGAGTVAGGFGAAAIIHMNSLYAFVTGKLGLAGLTSGLMATAGLAGTAMTAVVGASLVGIPVVLAGLALRHRAKKVKLPNKDTVTHFATRLLGGEDPDRIVAQQTHPSGGLPHADPKPGREQDPAPDIAGHIRDMSPADAARLRAEASQELAALERDGTVAGLEGAADSGDLPSAEEHKEHLNGLMKLVDHFHPAPEAAPQTSTEP